MIGTNVSPKYTMQMKRYQNKILVSVEAPYTKRNNFQIDAKYRRLQLPCRLYRNMIAAL